MFYCELIRGERAKKEFDLIRSTPIWHINLERFYLDGGFVQWVEPGVVVSVPRGGWYCMRPVKEDVTWWLQLALIDGVKSIRRFHIFCMLTLSNSNPNYFTLFDCIVLIQRFYIV